MAYLPEGMPIPAPGMTTKDFWDYCKNGELRVQQCTRCWTYRFPPTPLCYNCQSFDYQWVKSSGRGHVYSYIIVHHPPHSALRERVPFNVSVIQLEDVGGTRLYSNVIDVPEDEMKTGIPVELVWESVAPEINLYRFKRRAEA